MHIAVSLFLSCCLFSLAYSSKSISSNGIHQNQFRNFVNKFNKQYSGDEYNHREQVFLENLKTIALHNAGQSSFTLGINEFTDLTHEEFISSKLSKGFNTIVPAAVDAISFLGAPTELDWRNNTGFKVVPPVRQTGQCAASVEASIVDSIAADYAVITQEDVYQFNTDYVVKCDGGSGCSGTDEEVIFTFIKKYGLQWNYNGCPTDVGVGICVSGFNATKSGDEDDLLNAVASKGPISVLIDASQPSFQLYSKGIYYEEKCNPKEADHALLLVGYGSIKGQDYWIARNTWGPNWGQNGDILLARNKNNNCGIASHAVYATTVRNCMCEL